MASYSTDFKEQMGRKMMPPNSQSTAQISRESCIAAAANNRILSTTSRSR